MEHLQSLNRSMKTIKLLQNVNNYKRLNAKEAIQMCTNWDINQLSNALLKLLI